MSETRMNTSGIKLFGGIILCYLIISTHQMPNYVR